MKKITLNFNVLWLLVVLLSTVSVHGMELERDVMSQNEENQIQEAPWLLQLPGEVINHIAGHCQPIEKDLLMQVCQSLCKHLQDKESIMLANPSTVTLSHKIKKMFEYTHSGDAIKLSIWLSVLDDADINQTDNDERTPLYIASQKGHTEIVLLLLQTGAQVNQANRWKQTPLNIASAWNHAEVVRLLLTKDEIDVNKADTRGWTSLYHASLDNRIEIVRLLLNANGIDVNQKDNMGDTPLYIASRQGSTEVVRLLLIKKEIDVNKANSYGWTPLTIASYFGHTEIIRLLLQAGANTHHAITYNCGNPVIKEGDTALQIAQKSRHTDIVTLLKPYF